MLDHMVRVCFLRNCQTFPKWLYHLHFYQQWIGIPVVPHLHQYLLLSMFLILAILIDYIVLYNYSFNFQFLNDIWLWASFHKLNCHSCIFFGEVSRYFACFLIVLIVFLMRFKGSSFFQIPVLYQLYV